MIFRLKTRKLDKNNDMCLAANIFMIHSNMVSQFYNLPPPLFMVHRWANSTTAS